MLVSVSFRADPVSKNLRGAAGPGCALNSWFLLSLSLRGEIARSEPAVKEGKDQPIELMS